MNIYLDIDGVLLANEFYAAEYANEFLEYVLTRYPNNTYWLTTRCQGDASVPIEQIAHLFKPEIVEMMQKIKPTKWGSIAKTDAIDFDKPFLWFDDDLYPEERQKLLEFGVLENWIEIDLAKDPKALSKLLENFPIPKNINN